MTTAEIIAKINECICKVNTRWRVDDFAKFDTERTTLEYDLCMDSLGIMELQFEIEILFVIEFTDEEWCFIRTLKHLYEITEKKVIKKDENR